METQIQNLQVINEAGWGLIFSLIIIFTVISIVYTRYFMKPDSPTIDEIRESNKKNIKIPKVKDLVGKVKTQEDYEELQRESERILNEFLKDVEDTTLEKLMNTYEKAEVIAWDKLNKK